MLLGRGKEGDRDDGVADSGGGGRAGGGCGRRGRGRGRGRGMIGPFLVSLIELSRS